METVLLKEPSVASPYAAKATRNDQNNRFLRTEQEQTFYSRHSIAPEPDTVEYEFTRDPALIHQYFEIRSRLFISVWGLKECHGTKDEFDNANEMLIARQGRLCVGGARFTFATPEEPSMLPLEKSGLNVKDLFPDLDLDNCKYGECSRFVVLPEFRTREISHQMQYHVVQEHIRNGASYGFWMAPLVVARNYRQTVGSFGIPCTIRTDIQVPEKDEYEGIKMYIGMMDFTKHCPPGTYSASAKDSQPAVA
jgi:hypothetical protein